MPIFGALFYLFTKGTGSVNEYRWRLQSIQNKQKCISRLNDVMKIFIRQVKIGPDCESVYRNGGSPAYTNTRLYSIVSTERKMFEDMKRAFETGKIYIFEFFIIIFDRMWNEILREF